jgi:hypothetical protein
MAGWPRSPGLPVHLVVGLGYEMGKALGAVEYIQPSQWRLFIPTSPELKYLGQVEKQNKELIEGTPKEEKFNYDVLDPMRLYLSLVSMMTPMAATTKPVLLPFGPKIFFAVCLMISLQFPEVSVWHVSGEEDESPGSKQPSGHMTFFSFNLSIAPLSEPLPI